MQPHLTSKMTYPFDFHIHSLLSDGVLLPIELVRRYAEKGYKAIAITDHVDRSNYKRVVSEITDFCKHLGKQDGLKVFSGVELTHIGKADFKPMVKWARGAGIDIIVAHGETIVEPVIKGTNRAAIEAGVDILAHPGLISDEDVSLAADERVFLEITTRRGHCLSNGLVCMKAKKIGADLIIDNDAHAPEDIKTPDFLFKAALSCGLKQEDIKKLSEKVSSRFNLPV